MDLTETKPRRASFDDSFDDSVYIQSEIESMKHRHRFCEMKPSEVQHHNNHIGTAEYTEKIQKLERDNLQFPKRERVKQFVSHQSVPEFLRICSV